MSGLDDNWKAAIEYNRRRRQQGTLHDRHVAQLIEYMQRNENFDEEDIDGMLGPQSMAVLEQEVASWGEVPEQGAFEGWVYPMPILEGNIVPQTSSTFSQYGSGPNKDRSNHWGVDIMYRRHEDDGGIWRDGKGIAKHPTYTQNWYCPHSISVLAVGPGTIYEVSRGNSINVLIDHHNVPGFGPCATWYQHLHDAFVEEGDIVLPGDPIGICGLSGTDIRHLHFEFRDHNRGSGRAAAVVNPAPIIAPFTLLTL